MARGGSVRRAAVIAAAFALAGLGGCGDDTTSGSPEKSDGGGAAGRDDSAGTGATVGAGGADRSGNGGATAGRGGAGTAGREAGGAAGRSGDGGARETRDAGLDAGATGAGGTGTGGSSGVLDGSVDASDVDGTSSGGGSSGGGSGGKGGSSGNAGSAGTAGSVGRAGSDGNNADAGDASSSDAGNADTSDGNDIPANAPRCVESGSQLALFGDQFVNLSSNHTFPGDMNAATGLTIPDYAFGGTALGSGGIARIGPELDQVPVLSNLRAVIMDGGIDDLLVPDVGTYPNANECRDMGAASPNIPDCQAITQVALDALMAIFIRLANAGVEDVVYFSPPHWPTGTTFGGADPNAMIDYMFGKIHSLCDATEALTISQNPARPLRCHFVDMVPVFEGHPDYLLGTQIAESVTGSQAMASVIKAKLDEDCVARPRSSGCCRP